MFLFLSPFFSLSKHNFLKFRILVLGHFACGLSLLWSLTFFKGIDKVNSYIGTHKIEATPVVQPTSQIKT